MTSRERVIRTLNRQPVDRLPIDLGCHPSTGISMFAYWNLRRHLGLPTESVRVYDVVQGLAAVDRDVLERFHCDCLLLEPPYRQTVRWNPRGEYQFDLPAAAQPTTTADGGWVIRQGDQAMRMPSNGFFFDGAWLSDWGEGSEENRIALYAAEAERIYKDTDYALNFVGYSHGIGMHSYGGGVVSDAILAFDDPARLHTIRERSLEHSLRRMERVIDAFGQYIQIVSIADDMGSQNGLMCSPDYITEFSLPYYARFCEFVHAHSDIKVFLHCCGSIRAIIPQLIEAGIDVLNPVQISAAGMQPEQLKATFGDRLCFWGGGCDTQNVLSRGTPREVAEHVRHLVRIFKPGGGFVFNQVHNILGDVPPENIVAMLEAAYAESHDPGLV